MLNFENINAWAEEVPPIKYIWSHDPFSTGYRIILAEKYWKFMTAMKLSARYLENVHVIVQWHVRND